MEPVLHRASCPQQQEPAAQYSLGLYTIMLSPAQGPVPQADTPNAALRGGEAFTCLLRWAEPSAANTLPVVRMSANAPGMVLLARNADEYLHRCCSLQLAESRQMNTHVLGL